ncbi:isochorismatase family protein [Streptosporangium sp. NPDC051022]|uniref:isochorismatase family protein n=1 Tax=Streptosporangium sp. NPDC051022 TaxID=3155752 RepID=UPI003446B50B
MNGFGGSLPLGRRPGLVVVDLQRGFTEPGGPLSCDAGRAVVAAASLVSAAHAAGVPVWFTVIRYGAAEPLPLWAAKIPALDELREGRPAAELDPRLGYAEGDRITVKPGASAVFGTALVPELRASGVDTVLLCGASTSGCVRATGVDLVQSGLPAVLVPEACADRDPVQAEAAVKDLVTKYTDLAGLERALHMIKNWI